MKSFMYHPLAEKEALRAATYYRRAGSRLTHEFLFRLNEVLQKIQANPLSFAADTNGERTAPLKQFPYKIVYRELPNFIWIAALGHHSRRPKYWSRRKP